MGADTTTKSLTLGRGVGQSVYVGRNLDQKDLSRTFDVRITLSGLYMTKRSTVARLTITERSGDALEVALSEKHKLPVYVQDLEIFYTGVRDYVVEEPECIRCGAQQDPEPQKRVNGLITIRAPADAQICRGKRIGKNVR